MSAAPRTCRGKTKAGKPCNGRVLQPDGYCTVHSPTLGFDPVRKGKEGATRSAELRRARSEERKKRGRERLQEHFEDDDEVYAALKSAYFEALDAVTTCPDCRENAKPDHAIRLRAGDSLLAQVYGKPLTQTHQTSDQTIVVVNRLEEALQTPDTQQPQPEPGLRLVAED